MLDAKGALGQWAAEQPLLAAQAEAAAIAVGDYVWVYGGVDANGPVGTVQRGAFGQPAAGGLPANPDAGRIVRWDVNSAANLPAARANPAGWGANGALYLAGGNDGTGPRREVYWATPTTTGDIPEWKHLDVIDLPVGVEGAMAVITGPNAVLAGGTADSGPVTSSLRANIAPQSPFFQLGLVGATVPGLTVGGEIGQQLGYLNAAGVGTVNFIALLLVGWAFAHREQTRAIIRRVLRRRH